MICTLIPFSPVGSSLLKEPTPKLAPKPKKRPEPVSGAFFLIQNGSFRWTSEIKMATRYGISKCPKSIPKWEWMRMAWMPFWWILLVLMSLMSEMAPCDFFWPFITIDSVDACRRCNVPFTYWETFRKLVNLHVPFHLIWSKTTPSLVDLKMWILPSVVISKPWCGARWTPCRAGRGRDCRVEGWGCVASSHIYAQYYHYQNCQGGRVFSYTIAILKTEVNLQAYCIFGFLISKLQLALELGSADLRGQEWQEISRKETRNNMQVSAARSSQPCPTVSMKLLLPGPPTMKATNSDTKQPMTSGYDTSNRSKQRT